MILFNDFKREYAKTKPEIDRAIQRVLDSGWYILGKETELFESNFAGFLGAQYCVGVANGTEAIALALMANNIGAGDNVITTNLTAFPTITGIMQAGAVPVVVDIIESDGLIDPDKILKKVDKKTKAILPVHLYGQSCDLDPIIDIANRFGLVMIEDCAQATGATYKGKMCGTFGSCGAFSFYPTKNLGAYGDGGAVVTDDESIYQRLLSLRNYGQTKRYYHETDGINSRLDEIQAAILNVKLQNLGQQNRTRNSIAEFYRLNIETVESLALNSYGTPVNHLYVVKSQERDKLAKFLAGQGIQTLIHYPVPINRQEAFKWQKNEELENSARFANSILSIPIYPELLEDEIKTIVKVINEFKI